MLIYPTETFYALGCRAEDDDAIARIYEIKRRESAKTLPLLCANLAQVERVADVGTLPRQLIANFWPGPLTVLAPGTPGLNERLTNARGQVALRVSGDAVARELALTLGSPLVATSANFSGAPPAPDTASLDPEFLAICAASGAFVLTDGRKRKDARTAPSTIVEILDSNAPLVRILREGAVSRDALLARGVEVI